MQQADLNDASEGSADESEPRPRPKSKRTKISRACVPCRSTKTRCVPLEGHDSCEPCFRRSRLCIMPGPIKPRLKSSQKFSELEKKIESLTHALSARDRNDQSKQQGVVDHAPSTVSSEPLNMVSPLLSPGPPGNGSHSIRLAESPRYSIPRRSSREKQADVFEQRLIDMPTAEVLFNHWNVNMRPILPFLKLPEGLTVGQISETKPILFLAILAAASASILPSFNSQLIMELNEQLARQVLILGNRSVDLIHATLLYSHYYVRPAGTKSFAFTQYVSAALTMSCDMAIDKKARLHSESKTDEARDAARTHLAGWYAASTNATLLGKRCLMLPVSDPEIYLAVLSSDPDLSPSDQWLCSLVRLQSIMDDVSNTFNSSNPQILENFDLPSTQYKLQMFRQRLQSWKISAPRSIDARLKRCAEHFCNLWIHHSAIHSFIRKNFAAKNDLTKNSLDKSNISLSTPHFESLCHCLDSGQEVINAYISFEDSFARALPNNYLLWTLCAMVCLLKLSPFVEFVLSRDPANNAIGLPSATHYLDAMVRKISKLSQNGYLPQAKPCGSAFRKLKLWYLHKRDVCMNAEGECDVPGDRPVYSVLGNGPEPALTGLDTNQREKPNGATHGQQFQLRSTLQQEDRTGYASGGFSTQSPESSNTGTIPILDTGSSVDFAYDPSTYENTNWDDLTLDAEAMQEFDMFMMDEDDSWMQSIL